MLLATGPGLQYDSSNFMWALMEDALRHLGARRQRVDKQLLPGNQN